MDFSILWIAIAAGFNDALNPAVYTLSALIWFLIIPRLKPIMAVLVGLVIILITTMAHQWLFIVINQPWVEIILRCVLIMQSLYFVYHGYLWVKFKDQLPKFGFNALPRWVYYVLGVLTVLASTVVWPISPYMVIVVSNSFLPGGLWVNWFILMIYVMVALLPLWVTGGMYYCLKGDRRRDYFGLGLILVSLTSLIFIFK